MKPLLTIAGLCICLLSFTNQTTAQALPADSLKAMILKDWERAKSYTADYLAVMPADKYSLKATDSVRSFAQQMLHLAQGNLFIVSMATDVKTPDWAQADLEHSAAANSKDSVAFYVNASYDYCMRAIASIPTDKWGEKKKTFGQEVTRFALMMKGFEHQTHHRGQTTIYIRIAGVKPPNERLF